MYDNRNARQILVREGQTMDKYYNEQDKKNTQKLRELLKELPPFCESYFRGIEPATLPRTRLGYAYDLKTFFEYIHAENTTFKRKSITKYDLDVLETITSEDIEKYLEYITLYKKGRRERTNSMTAKKRKMAALRSLYRYFYRAGLISQNTPDLVVMPRLKDHEIVKLDPEEVDQLLAQVEEGIKLTQKQVRYYNKTKIRDLAILTLLLGTGMRVSECVGIDIDDIDLNNNGVHIHRKGGYNTVVYFSAEVKAALLEYLAQREEITPCEGHEKALFLSLQNKRICVRAIENLVKKYTSKVTKFKKITPHKLRSTFGTTLYKNSGDIYLVADVLGHKDVNTTRKFYAAQDDENRRRAANMVTLRTNTYKADLRKDNT